MVHCGKNTGLLMYRHSWTLPIPNSTLSLRFTPTVAHKGAATYYVLVDLAGGACNQRMSDLGIEIREVGPVAVEIDSWQTIGGFGTETNSLREFHVQTGHGEDMRYYFQLPVSCHGPRVTFEILCYGKLIAHLCLTSRFRCPSILNLRRCSCICVDLSDHDTS